jgi:ferredoxin/flavodoxin---NADP+ reductase
VKHFVIRDLITSGKLFKDLDLPPANLSDDRFMLCGSPQFLTDMRKIFDDMKCEEGSHTTQGHFVIEKAFVEK